MTKVPGRRALPLLALVASFCAGVFVDGWLRTHGPPKPVQAVYDQVRLRADATGNEVRLKPDTTGYEQVRPKPDTTGNDQVRLKLDTTGSAPVALKPSSVVSGLSRTLPGTAGELSHARLRVPIDSVSMEALRGGFSELRGHRPHEAADIVAPRGTPIHAVQDGTIAKLFFSKQGGTTIYQFDQDGRLCYYYAHLERYADGLHDGQRVSQGEVIGYVGSSGNAPPQTPHLHFAIFELNADRKWWHGRPLDPYLVFKEMG